MNVIVIGCGKIGSNITEQLCKEGYNVIIIDTDREVVEDLSGKLDVMGIVGNGASYSILMEAQIEHTDLLIAATNSDELNILCCIVGKKAGKCNTIARVRNPLYSREIGLIKDELGISMIINPEQAAAVEISRVLRFPSAIKIDTFSKGRVEILKYRIPQGSILHDYQIKKIFTDLNCDVLICAIEREEQVIIPNGNVIMQENDLIYIVASPQNASVFFKKIGVDSHQVKSTMLVGGGVISYYLAKILIHMGIDVTIIEKELERCNFLTDNLPEAMIIHGDAIDQNVLFEEGLQTVESFASLTNLDEENILLSLFAKSKSNAKIITKVHRITFDEVIHKLDIGSIICPKNVTAEYIIRYARDIQNSMGSDIETLYKIIENKAEAIEFKITKNCSITDKPLAELPFKNNILIACITHNNDIIIPKGQDMIREGDSIIVVTTNARVKDVEDILV